MKLNDERIRFYLRHREQLEEWWNLRPEVSAAMDEWLMELAPDVEALASQLGADVEFIARLQDTGWPSLYLKRAGWPGTNALDAAVLVGLQWGAGKILLNPSSSPYVGVQSDKGNPVGRGLREDSAFQNLRRQKKHSSTQSWAAWGYVNPGDGFPDDPEEYRQALLNSIRGTWTAYAPTIDSVIVKASFEAGPLNAPP